MADIERIKSELDIVDIVGQYVKLEKAGKHFKGLSPFTKEKTPSFFVSPDKGLYHCFSTGRGGDMFTFVQEVEGLDFYGSLKFLADQAGIELTGYDKKDKDKKDKVFDVLEKACSFFESQFKKNKDAQEYVKKRGIDDKTILLFRLGYAPGPPTSGWHALRDFLKEEGFSEEDAFTAGLLKKGERGHYDLFRDRVMFPIRDTAGRVVAFSGRILHPDDNAPKYVNSPETPVFNKSKLLYGYYRARQAIRKNNFAVLVEGQMDLVLSHQSGFPNTVAVSGTSLTDSHLKLVKRLTDNLLMVFDNDKAGWNSIIKSGKQALLAGMNVKTIAMPEGEDPADIIKRDADEWKKYVRGAVHVIEALTERIMNGDMDKRKKWNAVRTLVIPLTASIDDAIDRAHFLGYISEKSGIPESSLQEELSKVARVEEQKIVQEKQRVEPQLQNRKLILAASLKGIFEWISESHEVDALRELFEKLCKKGEIVLEGKDIASLMFETEQQYGDNSHILEVVEDMLSDLNKELFKEERDHLVRKLKDAEKIGDGEKMESILKKIDSIDKDIGGRS